MEIQGLCGNLTIEVSGSGRDDLVPRDGDTVLSVEQVELQYAPLPGPVLHDRAEPFIGPSTRVTRSRFFISPVLGFSADPW